jgi:hypothetical protein
MGGGGRAVRASGQRSRKGSKLGHKINILNENFDFQRSKNFRLLSRI